MLVFLTGFKMNAQSVPGVGPTQCYDAATGKWSPCGGSGGGGNTGGGNSGGGGFDKALDNFIRNAADASRRRDELDREYADEAKRAEEARLASEQNKLNRAKYKIYQEKLRNLTELNNKRKAILDLLDQIKRDEDKVKAQRENYLRSLKGTGANNNTSGTNNAGIQLKGIQSADSKLSSSDLLIKGESGKGFDTPADFAGSLPTITLGSGKTITMSADEYNKAYKALCDKDADFRKEAQKMEAKQKEYDGLVKQKEQAEKEVSSLIHKMTEPNPSAETTKQFNDAVKEESRLDGLKNMSGSELNTMKDKVMAKVVRFEKESMDDLNSPPPATPK